MFKSIVIAVAFVAGSANAQQWGGFLPQFGGQQERQYDNRQYGGQSAMSGSAPTVLVEVVAVRNVMIKPSASMTRQAVGSSIGGVLGGALGSAVGNDGSTERRIAQVLGGLLGAVGGNMVADPEPIRAQEITIKKVGGDQMVTIVQAGDQFVVGQRGLAVQIGNEIRLSPAATNGATAPVGLGAL